MHKALKLELDLSEGQIAILESQSKISNNLYNNLLDLVQEERNHYKQFKEGVVPTPNKNFNIFSRYDLRNQVPILKNQKPVYKSLYSSVAKNVGLRLAANIHLFLQGRKRGEYVGFPKERSIKKHGFFSLKYEDQFVGYNIDLKNNLIKLSLGDSVKDGVKKKLKLDLKLKKHIKFDISKVKTLEIYKDKSKYFAILILEITPLEKKRIKTAIALDPNHKNLAVGYDSYGKTIEFQNLYFVQIMDKRINQIKTKRNKCKKDSKRWNYLNDRILELYKVRRGQIQVGLHTIANFLCKEYDFIGIGNYVPTANEDKISKKRRNINNKVINQSYIGELRSVASHTCDRSGKTYIRYDEYNTTKKCSTCLHVGKKLDPSIREWNCENCGASHVRDENAAQNGYNSIIKGLPLEERHEMLPCSGHLEIISKWTCRFDGKKLSIKSQGIKHAKANCISKLTCIDLSKF